MLTRAADVVTRQVDLLARLVDDLLDVSRITQGKVQLRRSRLDLRTSISHAVETANPGVQAKRQRLDVRLPSARLTVDADPARMTQVVGNLLNNAVKYTPEGGRIRLSARRWKKAVVVRVRDDGVGIAPEMLTSVFDLFTQIDHSLDHRQGGLGVGLTVVRSLVQMHGGQARGRSRGLGAGSRFLFWLPAVDGAEPRPSVPANRPVARRRRRVLLVDDNVDAVESLAMLLRHVGHDVTTAYEAESALRLLDQRRPELVLLDIGLPGIDGYDLARAIRGRPQMQDVVLVALTGYGLPEDRRRAREAGFDHHLIKPAGFAEIDRLLAPD